jgi:L-ascorbate metabolism protein UlaG (beta-lactamase superfamily)
MNMSVECIGSITTKLLLDDLIIYFDPVVVGDTADIIFLSGNGLGFNLDVIKKISKKGTLVVGPSSLAHGGQNCAPGESFEIDGLKIRTIPAYFVEQILIEGEGTKNGYVVSGSKTVYFAGPTDVTPEMNVVEADVVIISVLTEKTNLFHALAATNVIHGDTFIPIAYTSDEAFGLKECVRFTRKCVYASDIARSEVPTVDSLNDSE